MEQHDTLYPFTQRGCILATLVALLSLSLIIFGLVKLFGG